MGDVVVFLLIAIASSTYRNKALDYPNLEGIANDAYPHIVCKSSLLRYDPRGSFDFSHKNQNALYLKLWMPIHYLAKVMALKRS